MAHSVKSLSGRDVGFTSHLTIMYYLIKSASDTGASYKLREHSLTTQIDNFNNIPLPPDFTLAFLGIHSEDIQG